MPFVMKKNRFSQKQLCVLSWWMHPKYREYDAIICDGAVRSGKTFSLSLSFVLWAMSTFDNYSFALSGKTITSLRRNIVTPLIGTLKSMGFQCTEKHKGGYIEISLNKITNRFYLFGGKDEGSAALIQGVTLAGILLDEVALMPRSFVEQAVARCSVSNSRLWFSCNPEHPSHWFYKEWIEKAKAKNALRIHFTMADNPSLSKRIRERYERMYSGVFYERFVLGKWTASSGLVYPMFSTESHVVSDLPEDFERYVISCDYGTVNPSSFGLWGKSSNRWYRISEYYYDSKKEGMCRTDEEHYAELKKLAQDKNIDTVIADPSAASFIECIKRHGEFKVIPADNNVIAGIGKVCDCLSARKILFSDKCSDSIREFSLYSWNESAGKDLPVKKHDHAMDDIRYFVSTIMYPEMSDGSYAISVSRRS